MLMVMTFLIVFEKRSRKWVQVAALFLFGGPLFAICGISGSSHIVRLLLLLSNELLHHRLHRVFVAALSSTFSFSLLLLPHHLHLHLLLASVELLPGHRSTPSSRHHASRRMADRPAPEPNLLFNRDASGLGRLLRLCDGLA